MKRFRDLSTRAKLTLCFGSSWLILVVVIVVAYVNITGIARTARELYQTQYRIAIDLVGLRSNQNYSRAQILEMMLTDDKASRAVLEQGIQDRSKLIDETLVNLSRLDPARQFQDRLAALGDNIASYRRTRDQEIALIRAGKIEEALRLGSGPQEIRFEKIRALALELGDAAKAVVEKRTSANELAAQNIGLLFLIAGIATFILGFLMVVALNRFIAKPLRDLTEVARLIAAGDLSRQAILESRKDEVGLLGKALARIAESLRWVADIAGAAVLLSSSASEILASTAQVASSTVETSAAISETTSTVEEVRQAARLSSEKAALVSGSALKVAEVSQTGQSAVAASAKGMQLIREHMETIAQAIVRLSEQGQSIGGIIASVTDLADQSRLLSVNAAIEAARAGEQGRGFAVVALEIKSMADQSKQATASVREILSEIQKATGAAVMATEQGSKAVETGVLQAAQAGDSIRALAESSVEAAQSATQVVASSRQQVIGMDQIGIAMESINQAGVQTAASMSQVQTAAQDLNELGLKLKALVDRYKT